ncbi:MAG TPA: isochorismatase family cysteine hydrolase [Candidatus Saccharimonadales bacterium]|nr:isochorismatase family cysteine hydrolase [Candidatus Saccharimonadales bacterium]
MKSALLVMDVQPGILDRLIKPQDYLKRLTDAVKAARQNGLTVIFVVVSLRKGFPEVSPNNKSFSAITASSSATILKPEPAIKPRAGEIVVQKRRVSAFAGSDLDIVLRAQGITHLILTGISTSGVVLSTLREAADKDFKITVLSDLCADFDEQVQKVLTEKVFPRQADVTSSADWQKEIKGE